MFFKGLDGRCSEYMESNKFALLWREILKMYYPPVSRGRTDLGQGGGSGVWNNVGLWDYWLVMYISV